jgi:hypothetical protein
MSSPANSAAKELFSLMAALLLGTSLLMGAKLGGAEREKTSTEVSKEPLSENDRTISAHAQEMIDEGREIFRFDTFGSEAFWGDTLQLHKAIAGEENGGVGDGVSPKTALSVGLKVDAAALPKELVAKIKAGKVDMNDPATTVALLKVDAVVGVKGFFDEKGNLKSVGLRCAVCHSTVDDSFAPGIGKRRDGWANRDLNVGAIISLAPNLKPFTDLLGVDEAILKKVLSSWGPAGSTRKLTRMAKQCDPMAVKLRRSFRPPSAWLG